MNAVRDRHAPGLPLDWGLSANRFKPATHAEPRPPQAVRRMLPMRNVEALKRRWFAIGSLATTSALAVGYGLALLAGWLV